MISDFRDYLRDSAPLNNLVGGRFEYGYARQGTEYPYIILNVIDDQPVYTLTGEADISRITIQVDCWAQDTSELPTGKIQAQQIADAVRNRVSGYVGDMGTGETPVRSVTMVRSTPLDELPQNGSHYRRHRVSLDFDIHYYRAVPDFT